MKTSTVTSGNSPKVNYYYRFMKVHDGYENSSCSNRKSHRADRLEPLVWDYVSGAMKNPEQLRDDLDRYIELERGQDRRGDPNKEAKVWAGRLAEVDGKRSRYQEMTAEDLISFEQLRAKLAELEEIRMTAEHELAMLKGHKEHVQSLERNRVAP